ncbi:MAG: outer membrane beta-barrel protein [Steroidobacter sp.]
MIIRKNNRARLGCVAAACALPAVVAAQGVPERELIWSLEGGAEHTDNVGRSAVDEESETVGIAALSFQLNTDRPRLDANVGAHLEYRDYLDDAFDSEVVGGVDGLVSYAFIPERFIWVATDNFGQIANERAQVDTPENRQNVNYFSTGPDIIFPLGGRTLLQLGGRISDAYYENTEEDNQSLTGSLALIRQLSDLTSLSLNGSTSETEYDEDQLFGDYRLDQAFVRLAATGVRTTFSADAGYTAVDLDGESSDGLLARVEASRLVGSRSRIGLSAGTEFATAGEAFRRDQGITGIETGADDATTASDPYQLDYAYLTWNTDWERSAFTAGLNARSEAHEVQTDADRDAYGATVGVSRQLSRRLDAHLSAGYTEEEFVNADFNFDEWTVGVGLTWLLGDRVSFNVRFDHMEGSSDDGTRDFEENRAYIGIAYSRRGP